MSEEKTEQVIATKAQVEMVTQENKASSTLFKSRLDNFFAQSIGESQSDLISNITNTMANFKRYIEEANMEIRKKTALEKRLLEIRTKDTTSIEAKILAILNNKKIKNIKLDGARIIATTDDLVCKASNGGLYKIGAYEIGINTRDANIRFKNTNDELKRRSYWGTGCHHPHVSSEGKPCLGNSAETILILNQSGEYDALFGILLAYLESANLDDCAGRHVANWDLIDAEGNVLREGGYDQREEDFKYNKQDWKKDAIEYRHECKHCGNRRKEGKRVSISGYSGLRFICKSCLDEKYILCECGTHTLRISSVKVTGNKYVCGTCSTKYKRCEKCGEYHLASDFVNNMCSECHAKLKPCSICGVVHDNLQTVVGTDKELCVACLEEHTVIDENFNRILEEDAIQCENCGDFIHKSEVVNKTIEEKEYKLCKTCGGAE